MLIHPMAGTDMSLLVCEPHLIHRQHYLRKLLAAIAIVMQAAPCHAICRFGVLGANMRLGDATQDQARLQACSIV